METDTEKPARPAGFAPASGSVFAWAKHNDGTVAKVLDGGGTLEDVIVALVKQKHELAEKCMRYVLIAPKKIKMADGSYRIWRCPDELVPES